ncbi:hypothetical protein I2483_18215 [Sporosarcina sp. E16_3]|uniref:hypothetical protein n=1 Tax=Sporosarcina sp. E16_3 TaxID=2789293 RepID=UPI001A90D0E8|nr:hypothetical protein [Sporosarcina sp. E16_3]MBO0603602.1 hypothetical protein [Sporosarcina sp. E16_3]
MEVKHEDDISDNTNESFVDTPEKSPDWLTSTPTDKKHTARSYVPDPHLGHAAGDYEPLKEDSRFHTSVDPHQTTGKFNKERGFSQKKQDELIAKNGQLGDTPTISSALDHD